jgi:uncharacterized protein
MPRMTSYRHGVPNWVDVSAPDVEATGSFYAGLFGWELGDDLGAEAGGYRMWYKDGEHVAGIGPVMADGMPPVWNTYVNVDDVDAACERVGEAGGAVVAGPMDLPNESGRMAFAMDPTGGFVGIYQAGNHIGSSIVNEAGAPVWHELATRDPEAALAFYRHVFGWTTTPMAPGEAYQLLQVSGRTVGGCMPMSDEFPEAVPTHWMAYFGVDDTDATAARCVELGGSVMVPPFDTPVGRVAVVNDLNGAAFSVITLTEVDDPNAWSD